MGFIKKNLLKVIEWKDETKNTIVYRFPVKDRYEIMTGSTLVVRESQVAIFVHKGKIADIFEPGSYKLSTENLPFITKILSLPTGFESPIKAELYYINTKLFTGQKWGTQNPITIRDKDFGAVRLRGYGIYTFKVISPETFLKELFGTNEIYTTEDVSEHIRPIIMQSITDTIAQSKIALLDLASNYNEFAEMVVKSSEKNFKQIGLELKQIVIENLSLPEEVEKALDERSKIGIIEDKIGTYTHYQAASAIKDAANNPNGNNMAGLGVGLGAAGAVGSLFSNNLTTQNPVKVKTKTCSKCGTEIPEKSKHCPECGANQNPTCPSCGETVSSRAKFCPNCGEKLATTKKVCDCGEELKAGVKFCPNCGKKTK